MADVFDRAQEQAEKFNRQALDVARAAMPVGPGLERCEDCGEVIPADRRGAWPTATRCLECQQIFEGG